MSPKMRCALAFACAVVLIGATADAQTKLLRFPDIPGDTVVFCYAGDLWTAPAAGGTATRLTAHPGLELFPRFSPDGKWIAFTGQYDGDEQVYVVPAERRRAEAAHLLPGARPAGAALRRTTTRSTAGRPTASRVLFRSMRDAGRHRRRAQLYTVAVDGGPRDGAADADLRRRRLLAGRQADGLLAALPRLPHLEALRGRLGAGPLHLRPRDQRGRERSRRRCAPSATRCGSATRHLLRLRPRRHAQPLRLRRRAGKTVEQLTHQHRPGTCAGPAPTTTTRSSTSSTASCASSTRRPARSGRSRSRCPTTAWPAAVALRGRQVHRGLRALAQGRAGAVRGPRRRLHGADRERADAQPDQLLERARQVGALVAGRREDRLHLRPDAARTSSTSSTRTATGKPERSTTQPRGHAVRAGVVARTASASRSPTRTASSSSSPSPTRRSSQVADDERGEIRDYAWSPDGAVAGVLAWPTRTAPARCSSGARADGQLRRVTDEVVQRVRARPGTPRASYLYYLSDREFAPQISTIEWNYATNRTTGIFALALRKDVPAPVPAAERRGHGREGRRRRTQGRDKADKAKKDDKAKDDKDGKDGRREARDARSRSRSTSTASRERVTPGAGRGRQLSTASAPTRATCSTSSPGAGFYGRDSYADSSLQDLRPRRSARSRRWSTMSTATRCRATARRCSCRQERSLQAVRRQAARRRTQKTVSTAGLFVDRVPAAGVGADLRRGLAPLPRLLLRPEHARLRLGRRSASSYRPWVKYVGAPLRPQLRARRDDRRAQRRPRLHRGRRLRDPGAAARSACRAPASSSTPGAGRYRIAQIFAGENEEPKYRSPLTEVGVDVARRRLRAGDRRRASCRPTTTPTACCATRPTR